MMTRLQKKCLIASAGLHLLLAGILFIGPAFLPSEPPPDNSPILDIIPSKLVDGNFSGGGNPKAKPPPPAPVLPKAEPAPADPAPQPEPVKLREPHPPQETAKDRVEEKSDPDSLELKPRKHKLPQISLKQVVRRNDNNQRSARAAAAAAERERYEQQRRLAALVGSTARNLSEDVAPSTGVQAEYGPGGGGEAYASYDEAVRSIYWHAWVPPDDTASDRAVGKASIVIARDGHIVSARLVVPSGDASVDHSIQRTLERVTFIAPFPEGAKDKERTYTIRFDLNAKRLNG